MTLKLLLVVEGLEGFNVALGVAEVVSHLKKKIFFLINSGIVFNNDVSEIIAFRHMVVSLAVLNHILRENTMTRKHCHNQLGS